MEHREGGAW